MRNETTSCISLNSYQGKDTLFEIQIEQFFIAIYDVCPDFIKHSKTNLP